MKEILRRFMRRPLCLFAVSYTLICFIVQIASASPPFGAADRYQEPLQKSFGQGEETEFPEYAKVSLTGQLKKKENKKRTSDLLSETHSNPNRRNSKFKRTIQTKIQTRKYRKRSSLLYDREYCKNSVVTRAADAR